MLRLQTSGQQGRNILSKFWTFWWSLRFYGQSSIFSVVIKTSASLMLGILNIAYEACNFKVQWYSSWLRV